MIRAFLATLCLLASAAHAETIDPRNAKYDVCGRYELYHINGVMTDIVGAGENLTRITQVYGNAHSGHLITYRLAYNQHRNFFRDFLDSAKQIISLYAGATWDKWMNAVTFGIYSIGMPKITSDAIAKKVTDLWGFTKPNPYTDQEMNEILAVIQANNKYGAHMILAPHSQGNFYATLVYDKLVALGKPAQSIGVVGLAVPYSSVKTGNVYLTSHQDLVIDSVRVATLGNVLPSNISIPYQPTIDVFGHNLIKTYMADPIVAGVYKSLIAAEFGTLKTVAASPNWAPAWPDLAVYSSLTWFHCPTCIDGNTGLPLPDGYWWYTPGTGAYNRVFGTLAQATAQAQIIGAQCYNLHITEVLRRRALGDFGWVKITGCWDMASREWAGSWWPYSGDTAPVFRTSYYAPTGQITTTAGATCRR